MGFRYQKSLHHVNGAGPTVAGGMLLVNSGYRFVGGAAGNVLLAFTVDGK